jgi:hypothetical protein
VVADVRSHRWSINILKRHLKVIITLLNTPEFTSGYSVFNNFRGFTCSTWMPNILAMFIKRFEPFLYSKIQKINFKIHFNLKKMHAEKVTFAKL